MVLKKHINLLLLLATVSGCTINYNTNEQSSVIQADSQIKAASSETGPETVFNSFPEENTEETDSYSLEEKYDVQDYIQENSILSAFPFSGNNSYKVRFTSDGGAVFSVKANKYDQEIEWKRNSIDLLFDLFHLINIENTSSGPVFYSRYSQLVKTGIDVNQSGENYSKQTNLVQTIGIGLLKTNLKYGIRNLTPVVIRDIEKDKLPYSIKGIELISATNKLNINSENSLIPWPGISIGDNLGSKVAKINVKLVNNLNIKTNLAVLVSIGDLQYQLSREDDNLYSGNIAFPDFSDTNSGMAIELIDKSSLTQESGYYGYTWLLPFRN